MVREFKLTGTALPHKEKVESLYLIKKKTMKKAPVDEIPQYIEEFMRNMKNHTLEALTQDVKARNSFFQFVRFHQNPMFEAKFSHDPKLTYFQECNNQQVNSLPVVSKIQGKALNLVGYRLNLGLCRALRQYLENYKSALTRLVLDNNGINSGELLNELLEGVAAQDDFKTIVIIKNSVDENSAAVIAEVLKRPFPRNLEELRIVNCKISPVSTIKLLNAVSESQLKKLSLSGAQVSE